MTNLVASQSASEMIPPVVTLFLPFCPILFTCHYLLLRDCLGKITECGYSEIMSPHEKMHVH